MNDYSMRGHPRERLIYYFAAAAFSLMPLITTLSGWLGVGVAISSFALFSMVFSIFDNYLWRAPPIRRLFRLPDLNGTWTGVGQRLDSGGNAITKWTAEITIKQTWSRLSIALITTSSRSRSGPASIEHDEGHGYRVLYNYRNDPTPEAMPMAPHQGTCELIFDETCTFAEGVYFNDHNRQSFGKIILSKK